MTVEPRRGGFQLQTVLMRAWRAVGRLRDPDDVDLAEDLRGLIDEAEGVLAMAPSRTCWPSPTVTDMTDLLWSALQAVSATAATLRPLEPSPEEMATRMTLEELAFELAASLWSLGTRPEVVCLTCGNTYKPVGLLVRPRCPCP